MNNCWEVLACGREPDGDHVGVLGVCPAATGINFDGVNRGTFGGRFCWAIAGTLCGGEVQGTLAKKTMNCVSCGFYAKVIAEEGMDFILHPAELLQTG